MSWFCNQCAKDFDFPQGDIANKTKPEDWKNGLEEKPGSNILSIEARSRGEECYRAAVAVGGVTH